MDYLHDTQSIAESEVFTVYLPVFRPENKSFQYSSYLNFVFKDSRISFCSLFVSVNLIRED